MSTDGMPSFPTYEPTRILRMTNQRVWHPLGGNRFVEPLPPAKNPIRARAERASRDHNAVAVDPKGTPQLPGPPRGVPRG